MTKGYEALFYNGWADPPAYYLLGEVEGRSPKDALRRSLPRLVSEVRGMVFDPSLTEERICETLYVLRSNGLVPAHELGR